MTTKRPEADAVAEPMKDAVVDVFGSNLGGRKAICPGRMADETAESRLASSGGTSSSGVSVA